MAIKSFPKKVHKVDEVRAASATGGVKISDDAGTVGVFVEDATGSVGIGTTSPSGKLEVVSGNDGDGTISVRSGDSGQYSKISLGTDANKATIGVPGASGTFFTDTAAGDLVLRADDNNSAVHIGAGTSGIAGVVVTEVADEGRVGIGVTDPDEQLEITGRLHMGQTSAPATTTDKLYNVGGDLTWNGSALSTTAGDITAVSLTGDSGGTLTVASGAAGFSVLGGSGLTSSGSGTTITVAGDDATTSAKGVASFSSSDFSVSSGAVSLVDLTTSHIAAATLVAESEGIGSNDNDTTIPTSAAVKDYVDGALTAADLDFQGDSGGALSIDLDSETLTIAGGSGLSTTGSGNTITVAGDDATTSAKGVASFNSSDFSVSSGAVSLADLTTSHVAAATLVTEAEGIGSNDNDTTLPTSAAVKDYVDNNATGAVRFALSAKLYTSVADSSNIYVTPNADNTYPMKWTTYVTNQDIGAIGDTVDTVLNYGYYTLRHMALMAAPVDCRLKALSFAFDLQSPDDEATSLKFGVFRGDYAAGSDGSETSRTAVHTWTTVGTASHTVGTGSGDTVDGQLIRGAAAFTHTSTDISAGQPIGFGLESFGTADAQGINIVRGVVTALFEAI